MKKLITPALLVAGLSASLLVGATSVSWAQEDAPSCAEAISSFIDARNAFEKLPETIPNPALPELSKKVEQAQGVATTREGKFDEAMNGVIANGGPLGTTPSAGTLGAELDRLQAFKTPRAADVEARISAVKTARQAEADLKSAQSTLDSATKARKDAPNRIDNPDLKKGPVFDALVKTQNAADTACEGQPNDPGPANPGTPTTTPPTAPPAADNDDGADNGLNPGPIVSSGNGSVVTPVGGVETGGGPA